MITVDANVLIATCNSSDASHARAMELIDEHEWDEFLTCAVTLAEVLVRPTKDDWLNACRDRVEKLGVQVVPFKDVDAPGVAALTAQHKLKSPDAAVLHTAITTSDALFTFDERLARVARSIGFTVIDRVSPILPDWAPPPMSGE